MISKFTRIPSTPRPPTPFCKRLKKNPTCEGFHAWPCQSWELIELCLILVLYPSDCSSYRYPTDPNNRGISIEGGLYPFSLGERL